MSRTKSASCLTATVGDTYRVLHGRRVRPVLANPGYRLTTPGPVPEQTNTRKRWPKTSRRPPVCWQLFFASLPAKSRPEVQEPGGFLGGHRR